MSVPLDQNISLIVCQLSEVPGGHGPSPAVPHTFIFSTYARSSFLTPLLCAHPPPSPCLHRTVFRYPLECPGESRPSCHPCCSQPLLYLLQYTNEGLVSVCGALRSQPIPVVLHVFYPIRATVRGPVRSSWYYPRLPYVPPRRFGTLPLLGEYGWSQLFSMGIYSLSAVVDLRGEDIIIF